MKKDKNEALAAYAMAWKANQQDIDLKLLSMIAREAGISVWDVFVSDNFEKVLAAFESINLDEMQG